MIVVVQISTDVASVEAGAVNRRRLDQGCSRSRDLFFGLPLASGVCGYHDASHGQDSGVRRKERGHGERNALNLVDHLLAAAGKCQDQGRLREALRLLTRFGRLPPTSRHVRRAYAGPAAGLQLKRAIQTRPPSPVARRLQHNTPPTRPASLLGWATALVLIDGDADHVNCRRPAPNRPPLARTGRRQVKCQYEYGCCKCGWGQTEEGLERCGGALEQGAGDAGRRANLAKGLRPVRAAPTRRLRRCGIAVPQPAGGSAVPQAWTSTKFHQCGRGGP